MLFGDLPLVGMLKQRMEWHQQRQNVLAQNVANADTPGFRARDLSEPDFGPAADPKGVHLQRTSAMHLGLGGGSDGEMKRTSTYEITPEGNGVVLEEEVMRVTQNVMDYQMVSQLYGRGLGMLKTALGRSA
jgi:flagellar basal-body rod protein FlgB